MKLPILAIVAAATAILLSSCGTGSNSSSSSMPGMSAEEHAAMKRKN